MGEGPGWHKPAGTAAVAVLAALAGAVLVIVMPLQTTRLGLGGAAGGFGGHPGEHPLRHRAPLAERLWGYRTLLPEEALRRGVYHVGSGERMRSFVQKLVAGDAVTVVALGGSVTHGSGASDPSRAYPGQFFAWLNATFPRPPGAAPHAFHNAGLGGTTSALFAMCSARLVPQGADLAIVEFAVNDYHEDGEAFDSDRRKGFERLLRALLRLPAAPAVALLHHYAWPRAGAPPGGLYYASAEADLTVFGQYYDLPVLSLRSAVYPLMLAGARGFRVDQVLFNGSERKEELREELFYADGQGHPGERTGHRALADLLIGLVRAVAPEVLHGRAAVVPMSGLGGGGSGGPDAESRGEEEEEEEEGSLPAALPVPMIPGEADTSVSVCLLQEEFKPAVVASRGFEYLPARPNATTIQDGKWAWTGTQPGDWAEIVVDSRTSLPAAEGGEDEAEDSGAGKADANGSAAAAAAAAAGADVTAAAAGAPGAPQGPANSTVFLVHLKSYASMGFALVQCRSGCECRNTRINGTWERRATLTQMHAFQVTPHERCRFRVTILERTFSDGHKLSLTAVIVAALKPMKVSNCIHCPMR